MLVALDRDGTILKDPGFFGQQENWKELVEFLPGVIEGIKRLNQAGATVVVCTNQGGVARGMFTEERVQEIHKHLHALLEKEGAHITEWFYAPYVPPEYAALHDCLPQYVQENDHRKPGAGMVFDAARHLGIDLKDEDVFFVGDKFCDVQAGVNAGGTGILIGEKDRGKTENIGMPVCNSFMDAVDVILHE